MPDPYSTPESRLDPDLVTSESGAPPISRMMSIIGWLTTAAVVYGIWVIADAMLVSFDAVVVQGENDPSILSGALAQAMLPATLSILAGCVFHLIAILVAVFTKHRTRGFFWQSMLNSVLLLIAFPIGTTLSVLMFVWLVLKRGEFFVEEAPPAASSS